MSLGPAIKAELVTHTGTAIYLAGVGNAPDRVYPLVIPQAKPRGPVQIPAVVYSLTVLAPQVTYCGTSGLTQTRVTLDCYAAIYDQAHLLAKAVRSVLRDFRGNLGGIEYVRHIALETEIDLQDPEPGLFRVSQGWMVWHVPA